MKSILPDVVNRIDELYHSDGKMTGVPAWLQAIMPVAVESPKSE